jgi:hypothetical protein
MRLFLLGVVLIFTIGCNTSGPPVEFEISNGFVGHIWLIEDGAASEVPLEDGKYLVRVPANGVLRVRNFQPFAQWHSQTVRYADGTNIPIKRAGSTHPAKQITFQDCGIGLRQRNGREITRAHYVVASESHALPYNDNIPGIDN